MANEGSTIFFLRQSILVFGLVVSFLCEAQTSVETDVSELNTEHTKEPNVPSTPAVKPAENIDLKEVVSEPLVKDDPVEQGDKSSQTSENESHELTDSVEETTVKPAKNVDLKKVVDQPLTDSEARSKDLQIVTDKSAEPENTSALESPLPSPSPLIENEKNTELVDTETPEVQEKEGDILDTLKRELIEGEEEKRQLPLVLLNSEVLPGTSTRLAWSPSVSFMGIAAPTAVLVVNGVKAGPTMCLTAAVHGDELNGIEIVRRVMYDIDPEKLSGAIIGVPIVNLQGFRAGSRYLTDRRDLNRFFPGNPFGSSASRIAYSFFNEVIRHCNMLVDLHTGSFRRTNLPQLRADLNYPEVANLSKNMGAIVVVQSVGAEGSLRRAATEHGIPTVTLEAGAPHELQKSAVEHGVKSVESALDGLGFIKRRRFWQRAVEPVYYQSTWVRAKEGGILFSEVELGATVEEGDLLGTVTDPITNLRTEIRSPYNGRVIGMALNQVMYPGFAAYHIGLKASVDEAAHQPEESGEPETDDSLAPKEHSATASEDVSIEQERADQQLNLPGSESDE